MPLPRPASLSPAKASTPHRSMRVDSLGSISVLEHSFATGNLDEIEYWIEQGVVREALHGQAPSKRDYGRSLMDCFGHWLNQYTASDNRKDARINTILDTLWQEAGQTRPEAWNTWLSLVVAWPVADLLLAAGANPWENGSLNVDGGRANKEKQQVIRCGAMSALGKLERQQTPRLGGEPTVNDGLMARIDSFMSELPHDPGLLDRMLGAVTTGGINAYIARNMRDHTVQPEMPKAHVTCWERWGQALLEHGAQATMDRYEGALMCLAKTAPHKPLERWDILSRIYATSRHQAETLANSAGTHPINSQSYLSYNQEQDVLQDALGRRALAWQRGAQAWLDKLLPTVPRRERAAEADAQRFADIAQQFAFAQLLDAPGGLTVAKRLAVALSQQGHVLPWAKEETSPVLNAGKMSDWVCVKEQRSLRRIQDIMTLVQTRGVVPATPSWRSQLALEFLRRPRRYDRTTEEVPGMTLANEVPGLSRRRQLAQAKSLLFSSNMTMKLPTVDEMSHLLDLAGPQHVGDEAVATYSQGALNWMRDLVGQLPRLWQEEKTGAKTRRAMLDLLAQRNILPLLTRSFERLMDIREKPVEIQNFVNFGITLAGHWPGSWPYREGSFEQFDAALVRLGDSGKDARARLKRGAAWLQMMSHPPGVHEDLPDTFMGRALKEESQRDPAFIGVMAYVAMAHIANSKNQEWKYLETCMSSLRWAQKLGWCQVNNTELVRILREAALAKPEPNEDQIDLIWDIISHNPKYLDLDAQQMLDGLVGHEANSTEHLTAWIPLVERLVEAGAWDGWGATDKNYPKGSLMGAVASCIERRNLGELAQQVMAREIPKDDHQRGPRRF